MNLVNLYIEKLILNEEVITKYTVFCGSDFSLNTSCISQEILNKLDKLLINNNIRFIATFKDGDSTNRVEYYKFIDMYDTYYAFLIVYKLLKRYGSISSVALVMSYQKLIKEQKLNGAQLNKYM